MTLEKFNFFKHNSHNTVNYCKIVSKGEVAQVKDVLEITIFKIFTGVSFR